MLGRSDLVGDQRMIYVLDLTEPNGVFMARDFVIRDGDTVYVTEAPFVQWNKAISASLGVLSYGRYGQHPGRKLTTGMIDPKDPKAAGRKPGGFSSIMAAF